MTLSGYLNKQILDPIWKQWLQIKVIYFFTRFTGVKVLHTQSEREIWPAGEACQKEKVFAAQKTLDQNYSLPVNIQAKNVLWTDESKIELIGYSDRRHVRHTAKLIPEPHTSCEARWWTCHGLGLPHCLSDCKSLQSLIQLWSLHNNKGCLKITRGHFYKSRSWS